METIFENKYLTLFIGQMTLLFGFLGLTIYYFFDITSIFIPILSSILLGMSIVFNTLAILKFKKTGV